MAGRATDKIASFFIRNRLWTVGVIATVSALLWFSAMHVEVRTIFADLLPQDHPYIPVHETYKETFGGANLISIMVSVEEGTIFQKDVLEKISFITDKLRYVTGINPYQITSLASKKLRKVKSSTYGIDSRPFMWPDVPKTEEEIEELRESVLASQLVYGLYVSFDQKAALITADFIDHLLDYDAALREVSDILHQAEGNGVTVQVVGEPILRGLVNSYLPETLGIFVLSLGALCFMLFFVFMHSWRGTLIPLINAIVSGIWALGIASFLGLNFDPLAVVITFLITARVISHSVQSVTRFDEAIKNKEADTSVRAAELTLARLWTPGILAVITDAGGILVVALAPIPLLQKTAWLGAIWVSCIVITGVIMTPVLLSWIKTSNRTATRQLKTRAAFDRFLSFCASVTTGKYRYYLVAASFLLIIVSAYTAAQITIGDANPGTPLLWQDSEYNQSAHDINSLFAGTDRMFVVVKGAEEGALKDYAILRNIEDFQRYVEQQPEIGGSVSLIDLIPGVNRVLNENNPRYQEYSDNPLDNGELLYMFTTGADPGDLDSYVDSANQISSITMFFRDHKGGTIRTAVKRIKNFIEKHPLEGAQYELAGGLIGVTAAVNEVIFSGQIESIAFALLVVLVTCSLTYRSGTAGLYFMVPILISNVLTFSYMVVKNIGLNVNSLPVAALGIGLGVDYAIYVVDSIKEHYARHGELSKSVTDGLMDAGRGVINTATPLIASTALWYLLSPMRFQAEMAILIAIWMGISAASALIVMPAFVYVFKPRFVVGPAS